MAQFKLIPLLLLIAALMLLVGCGGENEPASRLTPPTQVPSMARITPTPELNSIQVPWGLLTSLPVDVEAVLEAGSFLTPSNQQGRESDMELRSFTGFGMPKPDNPEKLEPQWKFLVPDGTPALAPITGYVVDIRTLWSGDFGVWMSADGKRSWVWEVEHVVDVQVEAGDFVKAGQPIATATGLFGPGMVELGLLTSEGTFPVHYCPLLYVNNDALAVIKDELDLIRKENFDRLNNHGISIPANDPYGQSCWTDIPVYE